MTLQLLERRQRIWSYIGEQNMFNTTITGRLANDPEMRYTDGGTPVAKDSIAHNWLYRDERLVKWSI